MNPSLINLLKLTEVWTIVEGSKTENMTSRAGVRRYWSRSYRFLVSKLCHHKLLQIRLSSQTQQLLLKIVEKPFQGQQRAEWSGGNICQNLTFVSKHPILHQRTKSKNHTDKHVLSSKCCLHSTEAVKNICLQSKWNKLLKLLCSLHEHTTSGMAMSICLSV